MTRSMNSVTVRTDEERHIWIEQPDSGDGPDCVVVDPSQVPTLVKWLQEAAAEIEGAN